jgi:hypothetical protein
MSNGAECQNRTEQKQLLSMSTGAERLKRTEQNRRGEKQFLFPLAHNARTEQKQLLYMSNDV